MVGIMVGGPRRRRRRISAPRHRPLRALPRKGAVEPSCRWSHEGIEGGHVVAFASIRHDATPRTKVDQVEAEVLEQLALGPILKRELI